MSAGAASGASSAEGAHARLLALAEDEIRRHGVRRMRVTTVAQAAGMTHANVYRYFPSRLALADAVIAAWLKPIEAMLLDAATAPDPALDKLERMTLALARAYRDRLDADPALFSLYGEATEQARPAARKHRARVRDLIGRVMEEAVGEAGPRARERATALLFDAAHRFLHPACLIQDGAAPRGETDARLAAVLGAVLGALRARGRQMGG